VQEKKNGTRGHLPVLKNAVTPSRKAKGLHQAIILQQLWGEQLTQALQRRAIVKNEKGGDCYYCCKRKPGVEIGCRTSQSRTQVFEKGKPRKCVKKPSRNSKIPCSRAGGREAKKKVREKGLPTKKRVQGARPGPETEIRPD